MPCFRAIFMLSTIFLGSTFANAQSNFELATDKFNSGEFKQALTLFLREVEAGNKKPQVIFNVGSVYLKLSQYENARAYFTQLLEEKNWQILAEFYLGYIAVKKKDIKSAKLYFQHVSEQNQYPKLKQVALAKLADIAKLDKHNDLEIKHGVAPSIFLATRLGLDSNPIAISDAFQIPSSQLEDSFYEVMLFGRKKLKNILSTDLDWQGYLLNRKYNQFSSLNTSTLNSGIFHQNNWQGWRINKGINIYLNWLDGEGFYRQLDVPFELKKNYAATKIRLEFTPGFVRGQSRFDYMSGTSFKLVGEAGWDFGDLELTTSYSFDSSNRKGLKTQDNWFSYSPTSNILMAQLIWHYQPDLDLTLGSRYSNSVYDGKDRLLDGDSQIKQARRKSDFLAFYLDIDYRWSNRLMLNFNFQSENNNENFNLYEYQRTEIAIGASYQFK